MDETYQAEAIDPSDLDEIVRERLSELIPPEVTDAAEATSERERADLISAIERMTS
jgi:hypothetical protein